MIIQTSHRHLKLGLRFRIIGLSLGIFVLNFLHMFVFLLPDGNRKDPSHILIGREHLARSLKHKKQSATKIIPEKARNTASKYYQLFLLFFRFRNHRFSAIISILVLISALSIYHAGEKAKETRSCIMNVAQNGSINRTTPDALYPGLNIENLCKSDGGNQIEDLNLFLSFARTLGGFFTFPVVLFDIPSKSKPVIFLGSTERFELFFNGETGMPFAVPVQSLPNLFSSSSSNSLTKNPEFTVLKTTVQKISDKVATLSKSGSEKLVLTSSVLKNKIAKIEERANRSRNKLHQLELGLDKFSYELFQMEKTSTKRISASIPKGCWNTQPELILPFEFGEENISSFITMKKIKNLALTFTERQSQFIIISGFSDPTGSQLDNDRLSHRRANEVKSLLVRTGVKETALYSIGHGENFSDSLPRRRVEIRDCTALSRLTAN
ncbi:MAG: OmpA family protein [Sneathiella sp.]|uniref:OmpA family protein n=1 Tax=Sneathiella sp. TaxID=1964365 RepID=UPI0030019AD9